MRREGLYNQLIAHWRKQRGVGAQLRVEFKLPEMNTLSRGDHLPPNLVDIVSRIAEPLGEEAAILREQAESARVVEPSATMLDIEVPDTATRSSLPDGPVPGRAFYDRDDEAVSEILLWLRSGLLIGFEQAWYTDDPPTEWPPASDLEIE